MAVRTFLKLTQLCKKQLVASNEPNGPFINDLVERISQMTSSLTNENMIVFYEAIATTIAEEPDYERKQGFVQRVLEEMWENFQNHVREIQENAELLKVISCYSGDLL